MRPSDRESAGFHPVDLDWLERRFQPLGISDRAKVKIFGTVFIVLGESQGKVANQLPIVLLGSAGGQIKTGRILDYKEKPNRKMCSMFLSIMDKYGVRLSEFGDSKERFAEI